jgi:hypothetical protein
MSGIFRLFLLVFGLTAGTLGGCPGADPDGGEVAGATVGGVTGTGIQVVGADADGDGIVDAVDADGGAGFGAVLLDAPSGAAHTSFDIFDVATGRLIARGNAARTPAYLPPGDYRLTRYFTSSFVYADNLRVRASATQTVALGALRVITVPDTSDGEFDLYDAAGVQRLSAANDVNVPIAAPAGSFLLTQYFNRGFVYAPAVTVVAGQTTEVRIGALRVRSVAAAGEVRFDIRDAASGARLSAGNAAERLVAAPAGTFRLTAYNNAALVFAAEARVEAGAATTIELGAVRYTAGAFKVVQNGAVVSSGHPAGATVALAPGTYQIADLGSGVIVAANFVVWPGVVTELGGV